MTNTLPKLSEAERQENLDRAKAARRERADLKMRMKAGLVSVAEALDDPAAQRIYVRQFLKSFPGMGNAKANEIMRALHIDPEHRRVGGLGKRQRELLIALVRITVRY